MRYFSPNKSVDLTEFDEIKECALKTNEEVTVIMLYGYDIPIVKCENKPEDNDELQLVWAEVAFYE